MPKLSVDQFTNPQERKIKAYQIGCLKYNLLEDFFLNIDFSFRFRLSTDWRFFFANFLAFFPSFPIVQQLTNTLDKQTSFKTL